MGVVWIVGIAAIVMIGIETWKEARPWPKVAGWWGRAFLLNGVQVAAVYLAGKAWDPWLAEHRLFPGERLGAWWGPLVGYLVITFVYYWWHRWRHELDFLWRWFHQVHHSPSRIEIITSFYKHPFEILANSMLSSLILYTLVGLDPSQAVAAFLLTGLAELFYHWNVATPHWLGYLIQRPESHCLHHERGVHSRNFADLPVWDMVFGTFENPGTRKYICGFGPNRERRLGAMLTGRLVEEEVS